MKGGRFLEKNTVKLFCTNRLLKEEQDGCIGNRREKCMSMNGR